MMQLLKVPVNGNDAVIKSSSQWQLKEIQKLNSSNELFIFKIDRNF